MMQRHYSLLTALFLVSCFSMYGLQKERTSPSAPSPEAEAKIESSVCQYSQDMSVNEIEERFAAIEKSQKQRHSDVLLLTAQERQMQYSHYDWPYATTILKEVKLPSANALQCDLIKEDVHWLWKGASFLCFPFCSGDRYVVAWNGHLAVYCQREMPVYLHDAYESGHIKLEGIYQGDPLFTCKGKFFVVHHEEEAITELATGLSEEQVNLLNDIEWQIQRTKKAIISLEQEAVFNKLPIHVRKNLGRMCIFKNKMSFCQAIAWLFCGYAQQP